MLEPNSCSAGSASLRDFIYFYIGAFAGGGIVLNGSLYVGPSGTPALGSMPVPGSNGRPTQLIDIASIAILEQTLNASASKHHIYGHRRRTGATSGPISTTGSPRPAPPLPMRSMPHLQSSMPEAAVIDGWMPAEIRGRLVAAVQEEIVTIDVEGVAASRGPRGNRRSSRARSWRGESRRCPTVSCSGPACRQRGPDRGIGNAARPSTSIHSVPRRR